MLRYIKTLNARTILFKREKVDLKSFSTLHSKQTTWADEPSSEFSCSPLRKNTLTDLIGWLGRSNSKANADDSRGQKCAETRPGKCHGICGHATQRLDGLRGASLPG